MGDLLWVGVGAVALELARVVSNLLDNAARHPTSEVAAHVSTADGVVTIDIDDDRPGISEPQRNDRG